MGDRITNGPRLQSAGGWKQVCGNELTAPNGGVVRFFDARKSCDKDKCTRRIAGTGKKNMETVLAALRALPAPEPVGEEELVEEMAKAAHYAVYQDINGGQGDGTPEDVWSEYEDDQCKMSLRLDMRAALSVVRAQDRREADEVRKVLREVLDATCNTSGGEYAGMTVREAMAEDYLGEENTKLLFRAERATKVKQ